MYAGSALDGDRTVPAAPSRSVTVAGVASGWNSTTVKRVLLEIAGPYRSRSRRSTCRTERKFSGPARPRQRRQVESGGYRQRRGVLGDITQGPRPGGAERSEVRGGHGAAKLDEQVPAPAPAFGALARAARAMVSRETPCARSRRHEGSRPQPHGRGLLGLLFGSPGFRVQRKEEQRPNEATSSLDRRATDVPSTFRCVRGT